MEVIDGFQYKRHSQKSLRTSTFSFDEVATPAPANSKSIRQRKKKSNKDKANKVTKTINNPRHDPNAKTRPSKRRVPMSTKRITDNTPIDSAHVKRSRKQGARSKRTAAAAKQQHRPVRKEEKLVAPTYPTEVFSGTAIREKANLSAESDKLHALFKEVLRRETTMLGKNYKGKFQFVMNAVKGVIREFLQTFEDEAMFNAKNGNIVSKNGRNVQLEKKRENLQKLLNTFEKEEQDWLAAKNKIMVKQDKENSFPVERLISDVSTAEIDSMQDAVARSVEGISVQLDALQKSLVASRHLSDVTMQSKDKLSEHFASYTHQTHGHTQTPRKVIKSLLRGPSSTPA